MILSRYVGGILFSSIPIFAVPLLVILCVGGMVNTPPVTYDVDDYIGLLLGIVLACTHSSAHSFLSGGGMGWVQLVLTVYHILRMEGGWKGGGGLLLLSFLLLLGPSLMLMRRPLSEELPAVLILPCLCLKVRRLVVVGESLGNKKQQHDILFYGMAWALFLGIVSQGYPVVLFCAMVVGSLPPPPPSSCSPTVQTGGSVTRGLLRMPV